MNLKLIGWVIDSSDESQLRITKNDEKHSVPLYEIHVDDSLSFTIRTYGWSLPDDHQMYLTYRRSLQNVTLSSLIAAITSCFICSGIRNPSLVKNVALLQHCVPKKFVLFPEEDSSSPLCQTVYYRSSNCRTLTDDVPQCQSCKERESTEVVLLERNKKTLQTPAKLKAPLSKTSTERIKLAMQAYRIENKELQDQIVKMKEAIASSSVPIDKEFSDDFVSIIKGTDPKKIPPFMKLFWEEQQKYLQSSKSGIRYHPMVIKFCLLLASKSPAAYEALRFNEKSQSGVLVLPSQRTLRSYKNYIRPKQGFNKEIIEELSEKIKEFSDIERFVVLLLDEMKIQENLVWDKYTGELIGFVNLGDLELNYAALKDVESVATHVLVYLIRSVVNPLKFSLANFATTGATSAQLFPIFWKAVSILELRCKLKVVAVTCDGASANRKFYKMHSYLLDEEQPNDVDVTFKTMNMFAEEPRNIYFFADPPHLMKTARNCLAKSGTGKSSRLLWNDGMTMLWSHISDLFYEDLDCGLKLLPKLKYDHVKLNPFSVMNVKLAVQVLSESVGKVLQKFGPPQAQGTAQFCLMMDKFFDCVNVRNTKECTVRSKDFLRPFSSIDDERFSWLRETFLNYFEMWLKSIEARKGNFTKGEKSSMFLSWQTYEGLKLTVNSMIELTKYLIQNDVPYVLTERFCQDPLENYFGKQRAMGQRRDNPSLRDFGYNDNSIRNQKSFLPVVGGNCREDNAEGSDMELDE